MTQEKTEPTQPMIKKTEVVRLAKEGQQEILPSLHRLLDEDPWLWKRYGNLALQAQASWAHLVAGENLYLRECLIRHAEDLRQRLAEPESSELEKLQIERIVALSLQVNYYEALLAKYEGTGQDKPLEYLHERRQAADTCLQRAITNLAKVRKMLPGTIKVEVVVSGEIETSSQTEETASQASLNSSVPTTVQIPRNRVADLLAAANN